jgi:hypothetical protein
MHEVINSMITVKQAMTQIMVGMTQVTACLTMDSPSPKTLSKACVTDYNSVGAHRQSKAMHAPSLIDFNFGFEKSYLVLLKIELYCTCHVHVEI